MHDFFFIGHFKFLLQGGVYILFEFLLLLLMNFEFWSYNLIIKDFFYFKWRKIQLIIKKYLEIYFIVKLFMQLIGEILICKFHNSGDYKYILKKNAFWGINPLLGCVYRCW